MPCVTTSVSLSLCPIAASWIMICRSCQEEQGNGSPCVTTTTGPCNGDSRTVTCIRGWSAPTQNMGTAAIFWRKIQGILRSRLCHPCWSRAPCGIEGMLSPKHISHPGSPCRSPARCRIFFSQVFPNGREVSRPKQNSHTWGLSLAPAQPAQGKRCHGYREKKIQIQREG